MQTRAQIHTKLDELLQDFPRHFQEAVEELLATNPLDLEDYTDNFQLPKLLYVEALRRVAEGFTPPAYDKHGKRAARRLARA